MLTHAGRGLSAAENFCQLTCSQALPSSQPENFLVRGRERLKCGRDVFIGRIVGEAGG